MKLSLLSLACALPALAIPTADDEDVDVTTVTVMEAVHVPCVEPTPPPPPCSHGGDDGGDGPSPTSSALPTGSPSASTDLALKRDWELDGADFTNLEMKKSCRMLYAKEEVPLGSRPPEKDPYAWVVANETAMPNLQTVNSNYFARVWCDLDAGWIKMQFSDWDAYNYAWDNWHDVARPQWGDYVIITPEGSCKNYGAADERFFVRATDEDRDDDSQTITCQIEDVSFTDTVGGTNPVDIEFENFNGANTPDGKVSAKANDAGANAQFDDLGGEVLREPSGDSDFDEYKDFQIGKMDVQTLNQGLLDEFNITLEDFYGGNDLPDIARQNLLKRGLFRRIRRAVRRVVKKVKTAVKKVVAAVKKVAEKVVAVVKDVVEAIVDFTTIRKELLKEIDFDTSEFGTIVDTPFGGGTKEGYLLFHGEFENETDSGVESSGSLDLFCVECGVEGEFQIRGKVTFVVLALRFDEGFVEITGDMHAGLSLGIAAEVQASREFKKQITSIPLTPFSIPNIFVLGPKADLSAGVELELEASGLLLAGAEADWPAINARLDIVDAPRTGVSGFLPTITPVFEVSGEISLTTTFFLEFSIGVGLDILNGKFDKSVALVDKPGFFISAGIGAAFDLENGVQGVGDDDCAGLNIALGFSNEVSVNVFDVFEKVLDTRKVDAFQRCIAFFDKRSAAAAAAGSPYPAIEGREPFPLLDGRQVDVGDDLGETTFDGGVVTKMFVREDGDQNLRLRYSPNGNTYVVPDEKVPENEKEWSGWFATDPSGAFVIGDSHGRFYHGYRDTILDFGVSRLRLHEPDGMPKTAHLITFTAILDDEAVEAGEDGAQMPYMLPTDLGGDIFFPIMCVYENGDVYPKMFLANDTETGVELLLSNTPEIIQEVTGGRMRECEYVPLTNGIEGLDIEQIPLDEEEEEEEGELA